MNNKEYQRLGASVLLFMFALLFMELCFELLEKKVIITCLISGTVGGVMIYFLRKRINKSRDDH